MADGIEFTIKEEDRGLDNLIASLKAFKSDKDALFAGVQFPDRKYKNGTTVGLVGMAHEFGAPNSRPPTTAKFWLRGTFEQNKKKYGDMVADTVGRAFDKGRPISSKALFLQLGPVIRQDLRAAISALPLIDTGLLLRSVGFRIAKETS